MCTSTVSQEDVSEVRRRGVQTEAERENAQINSLIIAVIAVLLTSKFLFVDISSGGTPVEMLQLIAEYNWQGYSAARSL